MATGHKGGWSVTIQTVSLLADPLPQPSLSEGLALGAKKAHRQEVHGGNEFRNFRRTTPTGRKSVVK